MKEAFFGSMTIDPISQVWLIDKRLCMFWSKLWYSTMFSSDSAGQAQT